MRRFIPILFLAATLAGAVLLAGQPTYALPEYATTTGEPCATCHISPSGGGLRTVRGQAWVGGGKPGAVIDLAASLELLGVHITIDEADYLAPGGEAPAAQPLRLEPAQAQRVHEWLRQYQGN